AGIAMRSLTRTSRVTRASTRSSTRASSLETVRSSCNPRTASAGTVTSTNSGAGGGGGTAGSGSRYSGADGCTGARVSHIDPPDVAGAELATDAVGSGDDARGAGRSDGSERGVDGLDGRDEEARDDAAGELVIAGALRGAAADGAEASGVITPSDSVTADAPGALGAGAAGVATEAAPAPAGCA